MRAVADLGHAYFVAPTATRADVLADGLEAEGESGTIWLYDSEQLARRRAGVFRDMWVDTPEGNADVWLVDMAGIGAEVHPQVNDGENVTVNGVAVIGPDRLTLIATV